MAASLWLLLPSPTLHFLSNHPSSSSPVPCRKQTRSKCCLVYSSSVVAGSSNLSSSVVTKEQEGAPEEDPAVGAASREGEDSEPAGPSYKHDPKFRGCKGCGRDEIERGCNGEGRIQGGIATVPGFGWWPIKAYRPCPGFVASGGRYRRQGQSMDDVASGRGKKSFVQQKEK